MTDPAYWNQRYAATTANDRSWTIDDGESLTALTLLLDALGDRRPSVLDVGCGASPLLFRALRQRGFHPLFGLDISARALDELGEALGDVSVTLRCDDVRTVTDLPRVGAWVDRATFHFLTTPEAQAQYRATLLAATEADSVVVMGVFAPDGPAQCSGLDVQRWSTDELTAFLAPDFIVEVALTQTHRTPSGAAQRFSWVQARKSPASVTA